MFTLAQYVFGIGKNETSDENISNSQPNEAAYYENDNTNQCVQTNIENDWILIDVNLTDTISNLIKNELKYANGKPKTAKKVKSKCQQSVKQQKPVQEESWFVEPPECFKKSSPDCLDVKTSSMENLLIEHPSMSVFDNLFVNNSTKANVGQLTKKPILKPQSIKKSESGKENAPASRNPINKKKQSEVNHFDVLSVSTKAFIAATQTAETINKKKSITKKNHNRQNKVAIQRNGPIIRHKKMFTNLNGVYHNRNHC